MKKLSLNATLAVFDAVLEDYRDGKISLNEFVEEVIGLFKTLENT